MIVEALRGEYERAKFFVRDFVSEELKIARLALEAMFVEVAMDTWDIILGTLPATGLALAVLVLVATQINKRIDDTNKRIDDTNKRIDDLRAEVHNLIKLIVPQASMPTKTQRG